MTVPLSVASAIEKSQLSSTEAFLPLIDIEVVDPETGTVVEVLHYARNPDDVTYQGEIYEKGSFSLELKKEAGTLPSIRIVVKDLTQALQERMQAYGGGVGFNVTLMIVFANNLSAPPDVIEYFQVTGASAQDYVATFTLGSENFLYRTFPRRKQMKDFCQWRYKDPDTCGYSGGMATCDFTLQGPNGCAAHNNTQNGGFYPGINSNGARYR